MSLVVYNEGNLSNLKNKFNNYNGEITKSLENIYREINSIDTILSTPKTNQIVPEIVDYYNRKISYMNNSINSFNKGFNTIITEYNSFASSVREMVGDNHD